ncbi:Clp protease N-terminal domain-containing protein [Streptomyces sp. JNUCC 64]
MFERFTGDARAVVTGAVGHAERAGERTVGEEHLLLALLDRDSGTAAAVLVALGADRRRESMVRALSDARRRAGLSRADSDALAGLGIDLEQVVEQVEGGHGAGALDPGAAAPGAPSRQRGWFTGPRFSPEAKAVLRRALRGALERREREIGDQHMLLALTVRPGVVSEVLSDHGVGPGDVRRVLSAGSAPDEGSGGGRRAA